MDSQKITSIRSGGILREYLWLNSLTSPSNVSLGFDSISENVGVFGIRSEIIYRNDPLSNCLVDRPSVVGDGFIYIFIYLFLEKTKLNS